ncbi:hypothetical protein O181_008229 [Austropuccinia psidii MF-1]|uniref:Uncharacterized protein n=1 Tax=Austropuccinia psidii MF-1 TaxID=1389203 RepID=A0A9Q3BNH0_9BASI|nr:hypothetical protein [Austropuccinia psidii MF-1]
MDRCGGGKVSPKKSQVVIGFPGEGLRKRPNMNVTKKNKKCHNFEAERDSLKQGDYSVNSEVENNNNEGPQTETSLTSTKNIQASQESEKLKNDTMDQDMSDIVLEPEPKLSTSASDEGRFLPCIEEFEEILNYHFNITK